MASVIANIGKIPELRKRIFFTLGMLAVYRIGVFVTVPGVDRGVMRKLVDEGSGSFMSLINLFSGGALAQLSILALGIMPYVSSSIILQLLSSVVPRLAELRKEGEAGYRKINQYTRYGCVILSVVQSFGIAAYLESLNQTSMFGDVVAHPGLGFKLLTMVTLTTGTAFIMWLGEQITERGIGNGISLIIFAGIVSRLPDAVFGTVSKATAGDLKPISVLFIGVVLLAVIATVIFFERGQRRIPIQHAKRMVGRKIYGGHSTFLPLRVNQSGVIPPIFASTLLMFPSQIASVTGWDWLNFVNFGNWQYNALYAILIIFFCYFYTAITFQPADVADNLKKQGAFIPGIRPGRRTAEYIDKVLTRITFGGACYVATICVLPYLVIAQFQVSYALGGTGLMIVVGVALDTAQQIESHLITRHYDGFTGPKGTRIRGRRAQA